MNARWIAGVDGCRGGWIAALRAIGGEGSTRIVIVERFAELLAVEPALQAIAVDMPIGLPDRIAGPGRVAEQAARAGLGARQSSLFAIPARAAVEAMDYRTAYAARHGPALIHHARWQNRPSTSFQKSASWMNCSVTIRPSPLGCSKPIRK